MAADTTAWCIATARANSRRRVWSRIILTMLAIQAGTAAALYILTR